MAISFNGIKSMLLARSWLKRSVERLSRPPQVRPSLPANGLIPPNGPNGAIAVEPYRSPLKELQQESRLALRAARPDLYNLVMAKVGKKRSLKELIRQLKHDPEADKQEAAAYALGGIGDPRATRALSIALASADREVRIAAATALGRIGGEKIFRLLTRELKNKDWAVREAAVYGLGVLGDERAFTDILMRLGEDTYWGVRELAANALGRMNNGLAVAPLVHAMRDEDRNVRFAAEDALSRLTDERGFDVLLGCMNGRSSPQLIHAAARALRRMASQRAFEALLKCLKRDSKKVWAMAIDELGGMRQAWADPDLKKRMTDLEVRPEVSGVVLAIVRANKFNGADEASRYHWGSPMVDFGSAVAEEWMPSFQHELTTNEARDMVWSRAFPMRAEEYKDATFPASIINGERENLAVRFDDPRAGEVIIELDPEKDIEIIKALYPGRRLKIDLEMLEANAEALAELERQYLDQYPGIEKLSQAVNHSTEIVKDFNELVRAIKRTRILIGMARRGLAYYGQGI